MPQAAPEANLQSGSSTLAPYGIIDSSLALAECPRGNETCLQRLSIPEDETYYSGWSRGSWGWAGVKRIRQLVNRSVSELRRSSWEAEKVGQKGLYPSALQRLQHIQGLLAMAPNTMRGPMRWLILVMVESRPQSRDDLRAMMAALPRSDFSVYHYDCYSEQDPNCLDFARQRWYSSRVVHRGFVTGSGCTVEALKNTITWMIHEGGVGRYTHLWKIDSDLEFGLFSYNAFRALVAHRAPFLAQPAILPWKRGKRATDRRSLRARLWSTAGPSLEVMGRERLLMHTRPPFDDVEIMCPLIDARILPALAVAIEPMDTRNDVVAGEAMNTIAQAFADAVRHAPEVASHLRPRRPGGLVFDFVPLIHRDSRRLGWGSRTRSDKNGTRCPRNRLDGHFGRDDHPHHGKWRGAYSESLRRGIDVWSWLPIDNVSHSRI